MEGILKNRAGWRSIEYHNRGLIKKKYIIAFIYVWYVNSYHTYLEFVIRNEKNMNADLK